MGWTGREHCTKDQLANDDVLGLRAQGSTWKNAEGKTIRRNLIRHAWRGGRLWTLHRWDVGKAKPYVVITVYLFEKSGTGWMYKDMNTGMHPYYYDCPQDLVDIAEELNKGSRGLSKFERAGHAAWLKARKQWLADVQAAKQLREAKKGTAPVGTTVKLVVPGNPVDGKKANVIDITKRGNLIVAMHGTGRRYRLDATQWVTA